MSDAPMVGAMPCMIMLMIVVFSAAHTGHNRLSGEYFALMMNCRATDYLNGERR